MDPVVIGALGFAAMFVLIALHVPIGVAMAIAGSGGVFVLLGPTPALHLFVNIPTDTLVNDTLAAIPLLVLMGNFAAATGMGSDIYRLLQSMVGHFRGGLAAATIIGCAAFGAICHSSIATATTFTRIALPEMEERGYRTSFAVGTIAAGGTLGILIPPSSLMLLYCVLTEQFVLTLFVAAIIPALVAVAIYVAVIGIYVRRAPDAAPPAPRRAWRDRLSAFAACWRALTILVLVTGGIYQGIFTVIEAAAVGCILTFVFCVLDGKLTGQVMREVMRHTASTTVIIYSVIFGAFILSTFVALTKLPDYLVHGIEAAGLPPWVVIVLLIVMYLLSGSFLDSTSAMIVTLPVVFPLVVGLGFDPIWWGVINIMVIEHGQLTPPIGLVPYVVHGSAPRIPLKVIFAGIVPFFISDIFKLGVLALFPALSLWLPKMLDMPFGR